jgi:hypothetical protein
VAACDRLVDAADARDKAAAEAQAGGDVMAGAMAAMTTVMQTQTEILKLAAGQQEPKQKS